MQSASGSIVSTTTPVYLCLSVLPPDALKNFFLRLLRWLSRWLWLLIQLYLAHQLDVLLAKFIIARFHDPFPVLSHEDATRGWDVRVGLDRPVCVVHLGAIMPSEKKR